METSTRTVVLRAVSAAWLNRAITTGCGLVVLPIVTSGLTPLEFGVWVLAGQVASFLTLSDAGSGTAVSRLVAKARGSGDPAGLAPVLSSTFAVTAAAAVITALITVPLAVFLPGWFNVSGPVAVEMRDVLLVGGGSLAVQCWLRLGSGILAGHQMYGPHAVGKVLEPIFTLTGVVALKATGSLQLVPLALVTAASILAAQLLQFVLAWRLTRPWRLSVRSVNAATTSEMLGLGSSLVVSSVVGLAHYQGLGLLVGRLAGVEAAGLYGVALIVMANLQPLINALAAPMTTLSSEWEARQARASLHQAVCSIIRVTSGLGAMVMAGTLVFGESVVRVLMPSEGWSASSVEVVATGLSIMGLGVWCAAVMFPLRASLQGTGQHWLVARLQLAAVVAGLVLGGWLLAAGAGVAGAAVAWTFMWAVQWVGMGRAVRRDPLAPRDLFGLAVLRPALRAGLTTYAVALVARAVAGPSPSPVGTLTAVAATAVAGGVALFWPWLSRFVRQRREAQR